MSPGGFEKANDEKRQTKQNKNKNMAYFSSEQSRGKVTKERCDQRCGSYQATMKTKERSEEIKIQEKCNLGWSEGEREEKKEGREQPCFKSMFFYNSLAMSLWLQHRDTSDSSGGQAPGK